MKIKYPQMLIALSGILGVLKITGHDIPWWAVAAPIMLPIAIVILLVGLLGLSILAFIIWGE